MHLHMVFQDWLKARKISESVQEDFNIHTGNNQSLGECIVIPVCDTDGDFIFNKYRRNPLDDSKPKYTYDRGGKVTLYGYYKAKDSKTILITEGEMDCLVAWSHNIPAITSTGGAMSFQEEWKDYLQGKEVVVCFDNDHAGADGMVKVLKYLPEAKILFLPDRAGIKDISDYVANGGDLHALLKTAKSFKSIEDVREDMAERKAVWKNIYFHEAYIKEHSERARKPYVLDKDIKDRVLRAKQYPIPDLIKLDRTGKAKCLWHNERSASMQYYEKTGSLYCFGCSKVADSIDVYKQINNCTFKEAVDELNKLI